MEKMGRALDPETHRHTLNTVVGLFLAHRASAIASSRDSGGGACLGHVFHLLFPKDAFQSIRYSPVLYTEVWKAVCEGGMRHKGSGVVPAGSRERVASYWTKGITCFQEGNSAWSS